MPFTFDAQAAFAQVTQQILLQTVEIQTGMLTALRQVQATQTEMQVDIRQLRDSHLTPLKVQNGMLDYMKSTFDQQAKWNERQDQFSIIFLDELRDVKGDVRQLKSDARDIRDKLYGKLKARIVRLEDFMNDQLRKAS